MRRYICGVKDSECTGSPMLLGPSDDSKRLGRSHATAQEALKCHAKALIRRGYTRLSNREFAPPDGGPVILLPKKWPTLRAGKSEGATQGNRLTPTGRPGEVGCIVEVPTP